jgi:NAD(P)-dependent dehydrogenase (short-subunit alcohol dehydrogenase family)
MACNGIRGFGLIYAPGMADPTRTALVTGGSGALGTAVTDAFLADGWRVVVPWVVAGELERLAGAGEPGPRERLALVEADLTDPDGAARAVRVAASDAEAPLRAVVNLVGGFGADQPVIDTPLHVFEAQFDLNLRPTYLVTQAALPPLIRAGGGSIVCMGSRAGVRPFAGAAGYCASKAAVITFAQVVAAEHMNDGVRCNAVLPSVLDTRANRATTPPEQHGKLVPPADVAGVIRFLCSDAAVAISGAAVPVYGRA